MGGSDEAEARKVPSKRTKNANQNLTRFNMRLIHCEWAAIEKLPHQPRSPQGPPFLVFGEREKGGKSQRIGDG